MTIVLFNVASVLINLWYESSPLFPDGIEVLLRPIVDIVAKFRVRPPALELAREAATAPSLRLSRFHVPGPDHQGKKSEAHAAQFPDSTFFGLLAQPLFHIY